MNNIGMGLKRINNNDDDKQQQRVKCEVLGINQYRLQNNKIEYQVFWKGAGSDIQMSWESMQNLQYCKDEVRRVVTQKKTKGIAKRRPAFPSYYHHNVPKPTQSSTTFSTPNTKSPQNSNTSNSLPSEEGEIKIQYHPHNHISRFSNIGQPQKNHDCSKQQQQQLWQHNEPERINNYIHVDVESQQPAVTRNNRGQKQGFYSNRTSQRDYSQAGSTLQRSEKLQPQNKITQQKSYKASSINYKIHPQLSCQISFTPQANNKSKGTMNEQTKPQRRLSLSINQVNINIEPVEKEDVLVTKLIKDCNKIVFQIMVYNQQGRLIKQRISAQQLRLKAPYALLKFYESRIIC